MSYSSKSAVNVLYNNMWYNTIRKIVLKWSEVKWSDSGKTEGKHNLNMSWFLLYWCIVLQTNFNKQPTGLLLFSPIINPTFTMNFKKIKFCRKHLLVISDRHREIECINHHSKDRFFSFSTIYSLSCHLLTKISNHYKRATAAHSSQKHQFNNWLVMLKGMG